MASVDRSHRWAGSDAAPADQASSPVVRITWNNDNRWGTAAAAETGQRNPESARHFGSVREGLSDSSTTRQTSWRAELLGQGMAGIADIRP